MVASIPQIIGKINPGLYAANGKALLKKYGSSENIPAEEVEPQALKYLAQDKRVFLSPVKIDQDLGAESKHLLGYDSTSETLEPVYFFLTNLLQEFGLKLEKLVDNFTSSPGSGHFGELGQRATIMQQQGTKILADINTVLRSVLNIIYDLKEFKIRLQSYEDIRSGDSEKENAALLSLKQIWMDKVDIQKGNSALKAMGLGQAGFVTLIDAFLAAKDPKDIDKLDLNDRVKRILHPRLQEFHIWLEQSERELKKRYELEKTYLRSQVNSLRLYSRWAKPYLKAAHDLEQKEQGRNVDFVKTFNTVILELTILGKSKIDPYKLAVDGTIPEDLQKMKLKRNYYSCVLIDFVFRGIPNRSGGQQAHFTFGGRADVTFRGYALNEDELKRLDQELEDSDLGDALQLIEGATTESLDQLQDEINEFLEENPMPHKHKPKDSSNPFLALFGKYNKEEAVPVQEASPAKPPKIIIRKDDFIEKEHLRRAAAEDAVIKAFDFFDIYKKGHKMGSYT